MLSASKLLKAIPCLAFTADEAVWMTKVLDTAASWSQFYSRVQQVGNAWFQSSHFLRGKCYLSSANLLFSQKISSHNLKCGNPMQHVAVNHLARLGLEVPWVEPVLPSWGGWTLPHIHLACVWCQGLYLNQAGFAGQLWHGGAGTNSQLERKLLRLPFCLGGRPAF